VVVYDGYCASTCTIFSEFMRQQANVSTIALGGRPTKDIIQAVGGVKGTNSYPWDYILGSVELPYELGLVHDAEYYSNETALGDYSNLPLLRATNYVVNARDGIRDGDKEQTPLHFVYEPADCRIYYTPEMVVDQEAVWKTAADTAFNGRATAWPEKLPQVRSRTSVVSPTPSTPFAETSTCRSTQPRLATCGLT